MVYKPLAVRVALIAGFRRALPVFKYMIIVAVAVVMWEPRRDFQGVWEGWKAGFMAFHAPAFPWLVLAKSRCLASIERAMDEAEEVSDVVFPSGDEPPEVVHPPRPSVRGSVSGVLPIDAFGAAQSICKMARLLL